jgi:hypothetical protein
LRLGRGTGQVLAADPDGGDRDEQGEQADPRGNKERTGKADRQGVIVDGRRQGVPGFGNGRPACAAAAAACEPSRRSQAGRQPGERPAPDLGDSRGCVGVMRHEQAQVRIPGSAAARVAARKVRGHHRIVVIRARGLTARALAWYRDRGARTASPAPEVSGVDTKAGL